VDIKFGRVGRARRRSGVKRLEILPNSRHPVLVFLGVTADRRRAVFLVDSTTSQSGEGKCRPDLENCTFVYLATDDEKDEHFFTDADGTEYGLHLLKIRAVEVKPTKSSRPRASRERERERRRRERGGEKTIFHFPLFADGSR
jgi:hypothetical protein